MRARVSASIESSGGALGPPVRVTSMAHRVTPRAPSIITAWRIEVMSLRIPKKAELMYRSSLRLRPRSRLMTSSSSSISAGPARSRASEASAVSCPTGTSRAGVMRGVEMKGPVKRLNPSARARSK